MKLTIKKCLFTTLSDTQATDNLMDTDTLLVMLGGSMDLRMVVMDTDEELAMEDMAVMVDLADTVVTEDMVVVVRDISRP